MSLNPFSKNGMTAFAKPLISLNGKTYLVSPSGVPLNRMRAIFPRDEDNVQRVFTTIADALSACAADQVDTVLVSPGTYTLTTALAMSKSQVRLIANGPRGSVVLQGSAADVMDLTASNCEVAGFRIVAASAKIGIDMAGASYNWIHDNVFEGIGGAGSHLIRQLTTACNSNLIERNQFRSILDTSAGAATQTSHISGLGSRNIIRDNEFESSRTSASNAGATTDCVLFGAATDVGNVLYNNRVYETEGATFTEGFDYANAGATFCTFNTFLLATGANAIVNGSNSAGFSNNIANGTV